VSLDNRDYIWLVNGKLEMYSLTPAPFVFHFHEEGYYTISLIMQSGSCKDTVTKVDYIHVLPPFPDIGDVLNTCNGNRNLVTINDSTYKAKSWHWDFGDGKTLDYSNYVKTLTHIYDSTGTYNLKVTATNGSCIVSDSVTVNVLLKQKPLLSADITSICTSDSPFISLSNYELHPAPDSSGSYSISKIQFGDLTSSTATIEAGTWTTSFRTRINGLETDKQDLRLITTSHYFNCEDTSNFIKLRTSGPVAAFTFNNIKCFKDSITLKDASVASSKIPINKWEWFFGDSTSMVKNNRNNVTYHYPKPGDYYLQLEVTDTSGCSYRTPADSAHMVSVSGPVTAFDASDTNILVNNTVDFFNRSSYADNSEFFWRLPGGLVATEQNPSFLFEKEGQFPVSLITRNLITGCTDTAKKTIIVKRVQSIFTYSISYTDQNNCPPVIASFTSQSLNAERVRWTFGDGGEAGNDPDVSHVYTNAGIYTVTLYSYDAIGRLDSAKEIIEVKGPYAKLKIDTTYGCTTLPVRLSADTVNTASFKWDFGDGTIIPTTDIFATHTYTTPGIYTPSLIMADFNGCTSISELGSKVILDSLQAEIRFNPPGIICDSAMVKFSAVVSSLSKDSMNAKLDYTWTSSLHPNDDFKTESALWFFNRIGIHDVTLTVTSPFGCKKEIIQQVEINQGVKAAISAASLVCINDEVIFKGSSIPAQNNLLWNWDLGNNTLSNLQNPSPVRYPATGPQNISLVVSNGYCTDTARFQVDVRDKPVINLQASKPYLCLGDTASLTAGGGISINWIPGPQSQSNNGFFATVRPTVNTMYKAVVTDSAGCTTADSIGINVISPFVLKVQSPVFTCSGNSVRLNAQGATNYLWSGDGLSSGIANPVYTPLQTGQVKVVANDGKNCFSDSAFVTIEVADLPRVELGPDQQIISGQEIRLLNTAAGDIAKWNWQPGQYLECTNCPSPVARPLTDITYSLTVTNNAGCTATDTIRIQMICGKELVWIPSGFTPNGDNLNDRFAINGSGIFIKRLAIFDRWGKLIFERRNISPHDRNSSWDGNYNGQPLAAGAYVYALDVLCNSGEPFTFKGTITLIR
jgi:gliding motility-associated-like protein